VVLARRADHQDGEPGTRDLRFERIQYHERLKIDEWLGQGARQPLTNTSGIVVAGPNMIPLYGYVGAASEGRFTMAEQNLRGFVPMHPAQQHVREAFALEVCARGSAAGSRSRKWVVIRSPPI